MNLQRRIARIIVHTSECNSSSVFVTDNSSHVGELSRKDESPLAMRSRRAFGVNRLSPGSKCFGDKFNYCFIITLFLTTNDDGYAWLGSHCCKRCPLMHFIKDLIVRACHSYARTCFAFPSHSLLRVCYPSYFNLHGHAYFTPFFFCFCFFTFVWHFCPHFCRVPSPKDSLPFFYISESGTVTELAGERRNKNGRGKSTRPINQ